MIEPLIGLVFMKFSNLGSYKVLNTYVFFAYLFAIFKILSDPHIILISSCFKMLLLRVLKLRNTYNLPPG